MHFYKAYGLRIRSSIALPELVEASDGEVDVVIQRGRVRAPVPKSKDREVLFHFAPNEAYWILDGIGSFLVSHGRDVVVDALPAVEEQVIRAAITGVVSAMLLNQRGFFVLHGSAVELAGLAVVFVGCKGVGKSTMAASLFARGHRFVTDDVVAVNCSGAEVPFVQSAFPQLKLWPDAAAFSLGDDPTKLPRLSASFEKRFKSISVRFSSEPVALGQVYVVGRGSTPAIENLPPHKATLELLRHSFSAHFCKYYLKACGAKYFVECTELVKKVPIYRLTCPHSLETLSSIASMVEANAPRSES